ncbi:MAG: 23S rRNA (uracil(1939)-C(5))-methyltransferase RlmD [Lachnospiraceae bacterium]|nr:23S rRNA (uracil(1939)-C(5))-methyltransferase RlmD [Lachnospiraceae bacterium]
MKKGQICEGIVERYAFPNKGYVRVQDEKVREICIKGALKGQRVSFVVKKLRKGGGEGRLLQVLEKSPMEDVTPACPHFGQCGGCAYQTMSYENQLALKEAQVKTLLDSVLDDSSYQWDGIKGSPVQEAYRNKMEFSFGDEFKDGPLALGMHKKGSFHDIVTVDHCRIVDGDYNQILRTVLDFYTEKEIPFYKKMQHTGVLRHLVVRQAACSKDILVNLVTTTQSKSTGEHLGDKELAESLYLEELKDKLLALKLNGAIVGILHTYNDSLSDAVIPEKIVTVYGKAYIDEKILGLTFRISPFSFFQTNSRGAEVLYEAARSYVGETKDKVIFDLYSGTGTIAQMLAPVAKKVIGVEIVEEAVEAAKENAALNGLANCEFIAGDVLKVIDEIEEKPDIIILDPPRDGIHPKALEKIIAFGVEEMVYISCKPTSLVRDLELLKVRGYDVVRACAIDQFVGTLHTECVVLMKKQRSSRFNE